MQNHPPTTRVAIDFGASNTDAVAQHSITGETVRRWTLPSVGSPSVQRIHEVLAAAQFDVQAVDWVAVTGGDRSALPPTIGTRPLRQVNEMRAIGAGGLALAGVRDAVVVSAGSGTAVVRASASGAHHITGTGVGGGTLIGLSRLLINSVDPREIDALASRGSSSALNLTIGEVLGGAIGNLPAETTAVNFGRVARHVVDASREDIAAALVNMVAQVIGVIALNAARAEQLSDIVVVGHLMDLPAVRAILALVGEFYGATFRIPEHGGFATATGALLEGAAVDHTN